MTFAPPCYNHPRKENRAGLERWESLAMFLIRTVFWLGVVVVLLPSDPAQQERLFHNASLAVHHTATFCDRNGDLCAKGAEHWALFRRKLDFGARMAMDLASDRVLGQTKRSEPTTQSTSGALTPTDLGPAWRGRQKVGA